MCDDDRKHPPDTSQCTEVMGEEQNATRCTEVVGQEHDACNVAEILCGMEEEFLHLSSGVILCGTCDLPAKALVLNMNQFNGKYGCPKCLTKGQSYSYEDDRRVVSDAIEGRPPWWRREAVVLPTATATAASPPQPYVSWVRLQGSEDPAFRRLCCWTAEDLVTPHADPLGIPPWCPADIRQL
ncbi:hypothetical protein B566_EDAN002690 [Ephemera danica]|nr:hypothetical protein B566_EDAN002690 [Ephemera danica]